MNPARPLAGLRVLDLSRLLPGPFLTQVLADLGADVVKVEEPGTGDYTRWIGPDLDGAGYAFTATNRGKRSVAIDLKAEGGAALVRALAARSDVLLEGFRPGVLDRLGLGDEALARENPRLVRLSLVGYAKGPLRDEVGHDLNYQSVAGILDAQGTPDAPHVGVVQIADLAGGLYGAIAVLAALRARDATGRGARLEVALADAAIGMNAVNLARVAAGEAPTRGTWELAGGIPGYRLYRCRDDRWIAFAPLEHKFWDRFVEAAGRPELDPYHALPEAEAHAAMEALFREDDAAGWVARLTAAGVPVTPVLSPKEALDHPYAKRFGGRPGPSTPLTGAPALGRAPALGEHTDEVLAELGYAPEQVADLRRRGVVGGEPPTPL